MNIKNIVNNIGLKKLIYIAFSAIFIVSLIFFVVENVYSGKFGCEYKNKINGYLYYLLYSEKSDSLFHKVGLKRPGDIGEKCINQFYEGLNQAVVLNGNNYDRLNKICSQISLSFPVKTWDLCYFKIGIATTYTKRTQIKDIEKLQDLVDSKIEYCEGMGPKSLDCIIGVYTGVGVSYQNYSNDSVFPVKDGDIFWICNSGRKTKYKLQCYRNMVSFLWEYSKGDTNHAVEIIHKDLTDPVERFEIDLTFYSSLAYVTEFKPKDIQSLCAKIKDSRVRLACIEGYATGLDEVLPQGTEGKGIVNFCVSPLFSYQETGECLKRGFFELPGYKTFEESNAICLKLVPKIYKNYCTKVTTVPVPNYSN